MWLAPPVRDRGTTRVQFGPSRATANSISPSVGAEWVRARVSLVSIIRRPILECAPRDSSLGGSFYRKRAVPNCSGLPAQWIFSAIIQLAYSAGVEPFLVHFEEGSRE